MYSGCTIALNYQSQYLYAYSQCSLILKKSNWFLVYSLALGWQLWRKYWLGILSSFLSSFIQLLWTEWSQTFFCVSWFRKSTWFSNTFSAPTELKTMNLSPSSHLWWKAKGRVYGLRLKKILNTQLRDAHFATGFTLSWLWWKF